MTGFNFNKKGKDADGKKPSMQEHCDHLQAEID